MKILHINSYYRISNFYKNFYDKQKEMGLAIDVYVPVSTDIDTSILRFDEYTTLSKNHGKYDRLIFSIKHEKIFKDIINKYFIRSYSIVHAHSLFSNGYIALKLKKNFGMPYIVAVRNTDVNIFFKYMLHLRSIGIEILKEAEKIIFLSESYRSLVIEEYIPEKIRKEIFSKTEIIPNGIDDFWLQNMGYPKVYSRHGSLKLVYVGVIDKNKNLITTTKAIKILQKKKYDVNFTVVGRVTDWSIYQQIIKLPYINYVAPKPKEKLIDIYRASDIFVMPSITETFGLVYAEAMSQGLPVIYTKGQGFDGQFEEGEVGYSVKYNSPDEMVARIEDIIKHYGRISMNAIQNADKFDWAKILQKYIRIYNDSVGEI